MIGARIPTGWSSLASWWPSEGRSLHSVPASQRRKRAGERDSFHAVAKTKGVLSGVNHPSSRRLDVAAAGVKSLRQHRSGRPFDFNGPAFVRWQIQHEVDLGPDGHLNPGHSLECLWMLLSVAKYEKRDEWIGRAGKAVALALERGWDEQHGGLLHFTDLGFPQPVGARGSSAYEENSTAIAFPPAVNSNPSATVW